MVVEAGVEPPVCSDPREDWVRPPISRSDLDARVEALFTRVYGSRVPRLDSVGTLYFDDQLVTISSAQIKLMELFVERFGEVVSRNELSQRLNDCTSAPTRNSLDLHIMRLRRRLGDVNLAIRTAWGQGYVLEAPEA
ncbi:response regulator transcription factor [Kribbella qitaiheensis]|uniref:Response regulator transcription factor n=1 Tax=Kribbella qitaiheensis TaxID=1544730 RepID=A0A7G6X924_9ACTN|nr:response regulator transcription factor [Kribbella qitaiheensis]